MPIPSCKAAVAVAVLCCSLLAAKATGVRAASACAMSPACWAPAQLRLPAAVPSAGPPVVVAIVDTGIATHPDLAGRVLHGWSVTNRSASSRDRNGHGTEIAGIVAGRAGGVCASCRILPVQVAGRTGAATDASIAAGIDWAADHGARVINVSMAGPCVDPVLEAAVRYATGKGALVVAAAGNAGSTDPTACDAECGGYPAAFADSVPGLISVAATGAGGGLLPSSNRGSWVMLAAPGGAIAPWIDGGYRVVSPGTSYAAAYVSGLAGLTLSVDPTLTAAQLETELRSTARQVPGLPVADGVVDARALLASAT
jgi:subtilisin family serine protease